MLDAAGARLLVEKLLPLATVITPNVDEASALTGLSVTDPEQMRAAARKLHEMGAVGRGRHRRSSRKGDRSVELHQQPRDRAGAVQVRSAKVELHPWHGMRLRHRRGLSFGVWAGDCPKPCCWPKPMWRRRSAMLIHWGAASGQFIIFIGCRSNGEPSLPIPSPSISPLRAKLQ